MACYDGLGKIAENTHIVWTGDFTGEGRKDILFYYKGDGNWWVGRFKQDKTLAWNLAGNTMGVGANQPNFGQVGDGRPIWIGDFTGEGRQDVLFYYPGDRNWWLGRFTPGGTLSWNLAGNTNNFGQVGDGRPIWIGDFTGEGRQDVLFYYPGDGNWWLGAFNRVGSINWNLAGNTGKPFEAMVRLHFKFLISDRGNPPRSITQFNLMKSIYESNGILVQLASTENLFLPDLREIDVGGCPGGFFDKLTDEQEELFENMNFAEDRDVVVYWVRKITADEGDKGGCATDGVMAGPPIPAIYACIVDLDDSGDRALAHEVGHNLGLDHDSGDEDPTNLMTPGTTGTNLNEDQVEDMKHAAKKCKD